MDATQKEIAGLRSHNEELRSRLLELEEQLAAAPLDVALQRSDERFRKIFDSSNDGIFLVDVEVDSILDVNAKACQMLGFTREELLSLPMSAIHPHEMDRVRTFAKEVFEKGTGFTDELSCLTKSGRSLQAEISASIIELDGRLCMAASVRDVSERNRLALEVQYLTGEIREELRFGSIIGRSAGIRKVLEQVEMVAPTDANVLITGESGTGKELVARAVHENSTRHERPMVGVNCASIPSELFESEFFGHAKGAFTGAAAERIGRFELADGGTLFLDEVGEIPPDLQSKLLRVLQEGQFERVGENRTRKVDVRIVAASNRDLHADAEAGRFRQDLYFRLSVFPIEIPPLRERMEDIASLARHCVEESSLRLRKPPIQLGEDQIRQLGSYSWPGNVRELQNVIERSMILAREGCLRLDLGGLPGGESAQLEIGAPISDADLEDLTLEGLKRMERAVILRALEQTGWKIHGADGAAALLHLRPSTLSSRVKAMGLSKT